MLYGLAMDWRSGLNFARARLPTSRAALGARAPDPLQAGTGEGRHGPRVVHEQSLPLQWCNRLEGAIARSVALKSGRLDDQSCGNSAELEVSRSAGRGVGGSPPLVTGAEGHREVALLVAHGDDDIRRQTQGQQQMADAHARRGPNAQ
jgi:hypothetical protein